MKTNQKKECSKCKVQGSGSSPETLILKASQQSRLVLEVLPFKINNQNTQHVQKLPQFACFSLLTLAKNSKK